VTIPSRFQTLTLPILISDPLWFSPRRGYIESLTNQISSYQQTVSNTKGYDTARFQINTSLVHAEDWYMFGIGRHLKVNDESHVRIWEGFVNKITFKVGSTTITVGPLIEVANKVAVTYSTIDTSTEPPTLGIRATTADAEDSDSQTRYAIFHEIISQGGSTATLAQQIRDKGLIDRKDPPRSNDDNFQQVAQPSVRIDCLGYYYFFGAYLYNNTGVTGEENISTKIQNVINDDPNGIFSTDFTQIATNTVQVQQYENDNARAKTIIEDLVGMGDASDNRYNFMVLKDRRITYEPAPLTTGYLFRLADRSKILEDTVGNRIRPWAALPGKWRKIPDLLIGRSAPTDIRTDLRQAFIVKTTFTAPNGLRLTSDELEELPQLLGKISGGVQINQ
jgi:hypothetical protein